MLTRLISALIGVPLLLALTYLGGPYTAFLVTFLSLSALREFLQLGKQMGLRAWPILTTLVSCAWLISLFTYGKNSILPFVILWLLMGLGRLALTYPQTSLAEAGFNLLSVFYTTLLFPYLFLLRQLPNGVKWTFLAFFLVWATDTGAYLIGRQFGRHLLAPQVSPKKTVEGAIGGFMLSVVVALVFWRLVGGASWMTYCSLGAVIGISGQVGDLFESTLKRSAGVKDSGRLIPGHGGILDRFDSFIFALPLIYYGVILLS